MKGLFDRSPSEASLPGVAESTTSVSPMRPSIGAAPTPTMGAPPRLLATAPSLPLRLRASGLLRHAFASNTMLVLAVRSIRSMTKSRDTVSNCKLASVGQLGIDTDHIVAALILKAMARIEKERDIGRAQLRHERADVTAHFRCRQVQSLSYVESKTRQRLAHGLDVIARIGE